MRKLRIMSVMAAVLLAGWVFAENPGDPAVVTRLSENTPPSEVNKNRSYCNGMLLQQIPNGRVWLVVNGKAMGFPNPQAFEGVIFSDKAKKYPNSLNEPVHLHEQVVPIADVRFIENGMWSDQVKLIRNRVNNVAIYNVENGKPRLYGFPSPGIQHLYHIDSGKAELVSDKEWASYPFQFVRARDVAR